MATVDVGVYFGNDVRVWVETHGLGAVMDEIIEHTRNTVEGLRTIEVNLEDVYDNGRPTVFLNLHRAPPRKRGPDRTHWEWADWLIHRFPPEVSSQFAVTSLYGAGDGR